jgi:hypothetical protein
MTPQACPRPELSLTIQRSRGSLLLTREPATRFTIPDNANKGVEIPAVSG